MTERRGSLETSLRNATRAQRDATQLGDWLATTERDLDQREATIPIRSVQDELSYAQVRNEERNTHLCFCLLSSPYTKLKNYNMGME